LTDSSECHLLSVHDTSPISFDSIINIITKSPEEIKEQHCSSAEESSAPSRHRPSKPAVLTSSVIAYLSAMIKTINGVIAMPLPSERQSKGLNSTHVSISSPV